MNLDNPISKKFYDLIRQIEQCGCSVELTTAVVMAGELHDTVIKACTPKWISVEERLPEEDADCDCLNSRTGGMTSLYFRTKTGCFSMSKIVHAQVTHWRYALPLPEPPSL